ncbi:MAG: PilZ domain-containing protein [Nitrospirae bacterium]|nr:PilZ domain-containing protein [Nitrospirota bacterium]
MMGRRRAGKRATNDSEIQPIDLRAAQRASVQIIARFSATDRFQLGNGIAVDLSETGCKISSTDILSTGGTWALYLTISETSRPALISEVRVAWTGETEYGIEFLQVSARELTRLRQFIWKHLNRSTLEGGPPLFTLVDRSSSQEPHLKSLP